MQYSGTFQQRWKARAVKYRHFISPLLFGFGFVLDLFTLNQIDQKFDLAVLLTHTTLVTFWLFLSHWDRSKKPFFEKRTKIKWLAQTVGPHAMQFSFGALFSGFVIFYTKSASLFICWPFLMVLYLLFIGNESFRHHYQRLYFQTVVYYFSILTLLIFLVPLWLKRIGPDVFRLSGFLSLGFIGVLIGFMVWGFGSIGKQDHRRLWFWVLMIFTGVNIAYYQNVIPAIPLSLKHDGIYYHVEKAEGLYKALEEKQNFWDKWIPPTTIHKPEGVSIYYFSAVFAPGAFKEKIVHEWQWYDEATKQWTTIFSQPMEILGGRDAGYRGYTYVLNPDYGYWRVLVKTPRGQAIGQKNFQVLIPEGPTHIQPVEL